MKHIYRSLMVLGALMLLSSCLVPEKFTCDILIKADGSYSLTYKGTMINGNILATSNPAERVANLSPQEKQAFEKLTINYAKELGIEKYTYIGNGRLQTEYSSSKNDGTPLLFLNPTFPYFTVSKISGKTIQATIMGLGGYNDQTATKASEKRDYKIDGVVTITSELPVLDAGGLEVQKKGGGLFGGKTTYVIRQVIKSVPEKSIVLTFGTK